MKRALILATGILLAANLSWAADLVITSFTGNGRIEWTYPTNGLREYRIEWCSDLEEDLWTDMECGMSGVSPTSETMAVQVPRFYRARAIGPVPTNMVYIPAGPFDMGDTFGEGSPRELPVHKVYVSAFYIERYEVSKEMWDEVYTWATNNDYTFGYHASSKGSNHPVHSVSWHDCIKWANARSEIEDLTPCYYASSATTTVYRTGSLHISNDCVRWAADGYRLPTEAEWEKAARGGASGYRFPWADNTISHGRANYVAGPYAGYLSYDLSTGGHHPAYSNSTMPHTSPRGSFTANGYGLYDMAGNLLEWCWDRYSQAYYAESPTVDPRGPDDGSSLSRIVRGGEWGWYAESCRVSYRGYRWCINDEITDTFRLVRSAQ